MVSPRFLPDVGGVEGHVYEVARRLILRGFDVTVLTTDTTRRLAQRDSIEGIRIRRVAAWPRHRDYRAAPGILSEIKRNECDVMHLHSHHTFVAPIAMTAAVQRDLPFVVTFHGIGHSTPVRGPLRPLQLSLLRPLLARAGQLVALTNTERKEFSRLLRLPSERLMVIPNGGDRLVAGDGYARGDPADQPVAGHGNDYGGAPVIASVGRLERFKGHHRLVAALPRVLQRYPDARLLIVGSGPEERALRRLAVELRIAAHVEITAVSFQDRARMASLLQRADVVALLSEGEGQPLAMLEAAALGRPLLVTEAPGLDQLVGNEVAAGVHVRASPDEIAEALIMQVEHPLRPKTASVPTWGACVDSLVAVYSRVSAVLDPAPRRWRGRRK